MIVCYSRCLYCGRQTPHEACHEHHSEVGGKFPPLADPCETCGAPSEQLWVSHSAMDPETCTDPHCKAWEPGEYESVVLGIRPPLRWHIAIEWKPEDCWIGAYWKRRGSWFDLWVCLLPMVPIHIWRRRE